MVYLPKLYREWVMPESPVIAPPANNLLLSEALLGVKLYIPRTPASLVSRPQLMARLSAGLPRLPAAALISAPPGFGKTTLLSEWLSNSRFSIFDFGLTSSTEIPNLKSKIQNPRVAWLSLDEGDNDPHRFLAYFVAALQTVQPEAGQRVLAELQRRSSPSAAIEPLLTPLLNEVAAIPGPLIFVLDDYHAITSPSIHAALTFLLNNLPPQLYLVIASRTEPPLPLARLRSRGQLIELHSADLSFTPLETAQFLNQVMGLQLGPEEVSALEARTEGWIAGLQMAALSMQGLRDTASFVKAFTGSHRYILDYLLEEVLQRQPLPVQKFLLQTSILTRLTGPLCDAITEIQPGEGPPGAGPTAPAGIEATVSPGQKLLWQLEQDNLFIIPLDDERRWYRYHQLFADALYHRLELTMGTNEEVARLHRRASHWYEQNGFTTEAMQHALAALDTAQVVRLVKQKAAGFLSRSELITLLSWLDNLPQEFIRSHSRAALLSAWAMVLTGQLEAVEPHLQTVEQALNTDHTAEADAAHLKGEISTIRAAMAYFRRDMAPAIELFNRALALLSPDNLFLRGAVLHTLGAAYSWQGNVSQASRTFIEAANASQATGNLQVTLIALGSLAQMQLEQGHLRQAGETYQEALQRLDLLAEPEQLTHASTAARLYIGLAELLYHRNELEQAQRQLRTGINLAQAEQGSGTLAGGYLLLARLRQAQGNTEGALEAVRRAAWLAQQYTGPYYWITEVAVYQARLWLAQDNLKAVELWAGEQGLWPVSLPETIPYLRETAARSSH